MLMEPLLINQTNFPVLNLTKMLLVDKYKIQLSHYPDYLPAGGLEA